MYWGASTGGTGRPTCVGETISWEKSFHLFCIFPKGRSLVHGQIDKPMWVNDQYHQVHHTCLFRFIFSAFQINAQAIFTLGYFSQRSKEQMKYKDYIFLLMKDVCSNLWRVKTVHYLRYLRRTILQSDLLSTFSAALIHIHQISKDIVGGKGDCLIF